MGGIAVRFRCIAFGLVPALALIGTTSLPVHAISPAPPNAYLALNEYIAPSSSGPFDIITGPDGNIWYTGPNTDVVVKANPADGTILNTISVGTGLASCAPVGITVGPDGNIWTACFNGGSVLRIIPSTGAVKTYPLPKTAASIKAGCTCPEFLTPGPDGYLWFTEDGPGYVSKLNVTTGSLTRYVLPAGLNSDPRDITVGADGNVWFTESFINRIGRMTTAGSLTTFAPPTANSMPWAITPGPDGNLYYTELNGNKVVRLTTSGVSTEFTIPTASSGPRMINVGPDGNLWFAEFAAARIGSMTPTGVMQDVPVAAGSEPFGVASGPDGNLWFTEINANNIGKIGTRHTALTLDKTAIGFGNVSVGATTAAQRITLTNNGADSLAAFTPAIAAASGASGNFSGTETCSSGPIAAAGTCYDDVTFTATTTPGSAVSSLDLPTDSGTAYRQKLSAGLSASVNIPSCTSVAISTDVASPQNVGATVTLQATPAGCPDAAPQFEFYLRDTSAVWHIVQPFSPSASFSWNTSVPPFATPGTYLIGVWVKDANSTKTYDAYAFGTFTLEFPYCTATTVTAASTSPQAPGATVNFSTTTPTGCPAPLYQWWVRDAAGVWKIVPGHDFAHSSSTYAWNTTGLPLGTYQVGVWVKQTGSTKAYDAYNFVTFTLAIASGSTHCQAANVTPDNTSPQPVGTTVTFTASPISCSSPQFKWWVRDAAGNWKIVKDYGVGTGTYVWSTGTLPTGTYQVGVWIRQTGSTAAYEAYSFITYTLLVAPADQPCTSVGITSDVPSPQTAGTTVTFTGAALDCPSKTYQFFVAPPGGSFGIVQAFSATATFPWSTTGLAPGPYQIGVWARNAGSTKSYEAFAFITFQLQSATSPCSTLSMFPSAHGSSTNDILSQSPQPSGIAITWNAAALGCASAQYAFYVQRPGSSTYHVLQSYSTTATAVWNTAGLPRGNYKIEVLTRSVGSSSSSEVVAISPYELT